MTSPGPILIGWKESIDLPDWGVSNLTAKADTGARRSAIDVNHIVELPGNRIQFEVAIRRSGQDLTHVVVAEIFHQTRVRSSNGDGHNRFFVKTRVRVGGKTRLIELSLTCRKDMNCRMLLGRQALEGEFIVDPSLSFVTRPNRKPKLLSKTGKPKA